jgi:nitrogen regulation protein NR(I)
MHRILIIDDDATIRNVLTTFLAENGLQVEAAKDGERGLALLRDSHFDVILCDLIMPGINGLDILKQLSAANNTIPFILITAYGSIQTAVEAMKIGAFDYVTKPFVLDELMIIIKRAIEISNVHKENIMLKKQLKRKYNFKGLIGDSPGMRKVYELIEKISQTDSTILITGESGTGKELVAKTLHFNSARAQGPFVAVNCAAIPKDLLESELFGHEKGAFTGASQTRVGRFELANRGTLFFDEVSELDPSLQVKLLRVLQEREFERVGGTKTIKTDARILAATNTDLEKLTKEGGFREDLFYRLNVIPLHIPPLKKRTGDIPLLLDHFVNEYAAKRKRKPLRFAKNVMERLMQYEWTGNVRELENVIERLTVLAGGDFIELSDLPEEFRGTAGISHEALSYKSDKASDTTGKTFNIPLAGVNLNEMVHDMEKNMILSALDKTGGIRIKAAALLGLNRTTLIEKMKKMGIQGKK